MKKKLIPLIGLTLSLTVAGIIMGFTLGGGSGAPAQDPSGQIEEPSSNGPPIRSDEGIDSDQPLDTSDWTFATSIDDIDPNVCNLIHNINACTAEELGELGMPPTTGSIVVGEYHPEGEVDGPGGAVEGKPGEAVQSEPQSDSGSSGFFYRCSDGEFGCVVVPMVSHGGPVKDYVSLVDNLRAAGATVDPAGTGSVDYFAPQGQLLTVNGEDVQSFEFGSAEEADAAAEGVSATGSSISRVDSETGMGSASSFVWYVPAHFYKAGKLIVLYVGCDSDVVDALQETMGPEFAGGAGVSQCPA